MYSIATFTLLEGEIVEYRREHPTATAMYFCGDFCGRGPVTVWAGSRVNAVVEMYRTLGAEGRL